MKKNENVINALFIHYLYVIYALFMHYLYIIYTLFIRYLTPNSIEYSLMSKLVGQDRLLLTNFPFNFEGAECTASPVVDHLKGVPLSKICLLDSEAGETLSPADAEEFDYFLFGGILGNGNGKREK